MSYREKNFDALVFCEEGSGTVKAVEKKRMLKSEVERCQETYTSALAIVHSFVSSVTSKTAFRVLEEIAKV